MKTLLEKGMVKKVCCPRCQRFHQTQVKNVIRLK
jgi:hypothetical protein